MKKPFELWIFCLVGLWTAAGCDRPAPPAPPPPPAVTVSRPLEREVIEWDEYTGRLDPVDSVDLRARVSGLIETAPFQEGSNVKKGDVLFTIDVRPFQADLDKALSQVASAEAQIHFWEPETKRFKDLREKGAGSDVELLKAQQSLDSFKADLLGAKAAVAAAQLNV